MDYGGSTHRVLTKLRLHLYLTVLGAAFECLWVQASMVVGPYLQSANPHHLWIVWETDGESESKVVWGLTHSLGSSSYGSSKVGQQKSRIHEVRLDGLNADTRYFYRVPEDPTIYHFKTPPKKFQKKAFRFAVYSDNQDNPTKHAELVERGIVKMMKGYGPELTDQLAFVMVTGDIVSKGDRYSQYKERFFDPIQSISAFVPYYTQIGNHEWIPPLYLNYMHLPENGSSNFLERWYSFNYSNVHLVGLDTNGESQTEEQLEWLEADLETVCNDSSIDFTFLFFHHPYLSEIWPEAGESEYSGKLVARLQSHLDRCQKAGGHFFGHTHAYARGQSRDSNLFWVNAASASGHIDHWGMFPHKTYDVYQKSIDEYGFVIVDVTAGDNATFRIQRISRGDERVIKENELQDDVLFKKNNLVPDRPYGLGLPMLIDLAAGAVELHASDFVDPDGDIHLESQWQVSKISGDYTDPLEDRWERFEKIWWRRNLREGADLTKFLVTGLEPDLMYYWRVRYRDGSLGWSKWSEEMKFKIG